MIQTVLDQSKIKAKEYMCNLSRFMLSLNGFKKEESIYVPTISRTPLYLYQVKEGICEKRIFWGHEKNIAGIDWIIDPIFQNRSFPKSNCKLI